MHEFISRYSNVKEVESRFNMGLINRTNDDDLITYIVDACKSLEVIENIEFIGYDYTDDESKIDMNRYMTTRSTKPKDKNKKYIFIHDNRVGELTVKFRLRCWSKEKKEIIEKIIDKKILIPIPDENNYYLMKGKKFFLLYQMVDTSTYNTKDSVVLRSLLPIDVKRSHMDIVDSNKDEYSCAVFTIKMFNKDRDILPFYFATKGFYETIDYFGLTGIIGLIEDNDNKEGFMYFPISSKLYIKVVERFFRNFKFVRSFIAMMLRVNTNRSTLDSIVDRNYWIEYIGKFNSSGQSKNYYEKGKSTLMFLSRMVDITTKKVLRVSEENKEDVFAILRWILLSYDELRNKDNLDLGNKRLRYNEFIGALFTSVLSEKLNSKVIGRNRNNLDMDMLKDIFKFPGNIILTILYKSGLLRFDDINNDLDFPTKLKFSRKGISTLGNKSQRTISKRFRALHPSHIRRIDLTAIGNSDPGSSGVLCPAIKSDGLYLSDKNEPETAFYELCRQADDYLETEGWMVLTDYDNEEEFYKGQDVGRELLAGVVVNIKSTKSKGGNSSEENTKSFKL